MLVIIFPQNMHWWSPYFPKFPTCFIMFPYILPDLSIYSEWFYGRITIYFYFIVPFIPYIPYISHIYPIYPIYPTYPTYPIGESPCILQPIPLANLQAWWRKPWTWWTWTATAPCSGNFTWWTWWTCPLGIGMTNVAMVKPWPIEIDGLPMKHGDPSCSFV